MQGVWGREQGTETGSVTRDTEIRRRNTERNNCKYMELHTSGSHHSTNDMNSGPRCPHTQPPTPASTARKVISCSKAQHQRGRSRQNNISRSPSASPLYASMPGATKRPQNGE